MTPRKNERPARELERRIEDVVPLPERSSDDRSHEDVRYHLYVLEKIRRGLASAESEGVVEQEEAEARLSRWLGG